MTARRVSLQAWLFAACTGGVASPPPGQPSPPSPPPATLEATTLKETEKQLLEDLAGTTPPQQRRRFVTVYYVSDQIAAGLLSDWFQRQQGVAAVRLHESPRRFRVQGIASRVGGAVAFAEEEWWELEVESPSGLLEPSDVTAWVRLLRAAPPDARWRLGPSIVAKS